MGLAILTKGPVIFAYLLPLLFLKEIFNTPRNWKRCLIQNGGACLIACGIGLSWALAAAYQGGDDYAYSLLWKQTMDRLAHSPYHQRTWWFYVMAFPLFMLPWALIHPFRTIPWKRFLKQDASLLIIGWIGCLLLIFTLVSCKQLQYIIPSIPLLSIFFAQSYALSGRSLKRVTGMIISSYGLLAILIYPLNQSLEKRLPLVSISKALSPFHDRPLAIVHTVYHGELGFPIRRSNITCFRDEKNLREWFVQHPNGIAVIFNSPRFFPGYPHFDWFHPYPQGGWDYLKKRAHFFEEYTVINRFSGPYGDKIIIRKDISPLTGAFHS
jgi:hypothetical protein